MMATPRNAPGGPGAEGNDMRTPRRHRLTRRQSEQVLDGLGGHDDLTRLLAAARPVRVDGELPGEAAAVAAFRSAAVTALDPQPRSPSVTTLSLSRGLLVKVVAVATASFAVGGVALAASGGHLPGSHPTTPAAQASTTTTRLMSADQDGTADGQGPQRSVTRSGSPSTSPRPEDLHAIGLCRAWAEVTKNTGPNGPVSKAQAFQELQTRAGGAAKVAAYCEGMVTTWCESHRWPSATPVQIDGTATVMRCLRPTTSTGPSSPPAGVPGGRPSGMPSTGPGAPSGTTPPMHGKPTGAPIGAPIRN
jgi:hypothetical protein